MKTYQLVLEPDKNKDALQTLKTICGCLVVSCKIGVTVSSCTINSDSLDLHLNDLWKYDGIKWSWISGSRFFDDLGNYGNKGVPSSSNVPSARRAHGVAARNNELWVFGGTNAGKFVSMHNLQKVETTMICGNSTV